MAYDAPSLAPDGELQVDDPAVRSGMIRALDAYTLIWRKGCTPSTSRTWTNIDNNRHFFDQTIVMTPNTTLSIPAALKRDQPDLYRDAAATIDWPAGADGEPLLIAGFIQRAVAFNDAPDPDLAVEFARFLIEEGWLAHWLTFAGDRFLPPIRKLIEQPFWLDPADPHRLRAAVQIMSRPHYIDSGVNGLERRSVRVWDENVWGQAVNRVVEDGLTPEQAVDEAVRRIKEILKE